MPTCVVGAERTEVTSAVVIFFIFFFVGILSVKCSCQRQLVHLDQSCWTRRFFIDLNMVFNFSTIFYLLVITSRQREFSNFSFLDFLLSTWSARVRRALGALGRPKKSRPRPHFYCRLLQLFNIRVSAFLTAPSCSASSC